MTALLKASIRSRPISIEKTLPGIAEHAVKQREESERLPPYSAMVGQSESIRRIRAQIRRLSDKDITVLITGESGTGKELIARAIHYHSPRRNGPLVKINCAALPDELLESEIFGFQKGAFTGAHKTKPGRIELAQGGTLFVDEIGRPFSESAGQVPSGTRGQGLCAAGGHGGPFGGCQGRCGHQRAPPQEGDGRDLSEKTCTIV